MVPDVKFRVFQSNDLPVTVNVEVFIVVFQYSNTISLNIYFPYEIKIILKGKMKSESLNESIFQTNFVYKNLEHKSLLRYLVMKTYTIGLPVIHCFQLPEVVTQFAFACNEQFQRIASEVWGHFDPLRFHYNRISIDRIHHPFLGCLPLWRKIDKYL